MRTSRSSSAGRDAVVPPPCARVPPPPQGQAARQSGDVRGRSGMRLAHTTPHPGPPALKKAPPRPGSFTPMRPVTELAPAHTREASSRAPPSFLEASPIPHKNPHSRLVPVRVLVAANGYLEYTTASRHSRGARPGSQAIEGRGDGADVIACSDTFVQIHTTYTDSKRFMFHKVFGLTKPTDTMFKEVLPAVLDVANGVNAQIVLYGQAGTGKSNILQGSRTNPGLAGLLPRVLNDLLAQQARLNLLITMAVFTIDNECVTDALGREVLDSCDVGADGFTPRILSDKAAVNDVLLRDRTGAFALLHAALNIVHACGERGPQHTIVQMIVERSTADGTGLQGVLTITDLCGYNDSRASGRSPVQMSLLNIEQLVRARCNGEFMAASSCLLTRLLYESFGGNARTVLIATISSVHTDLKATLHTLQLARQAMTTRDRPTFNFACRKDTPHLGKGKSRSGQSISLVHRFDAAVREMDWNPGAAPPSRTLATHIDTLEMWLALKPVVSWGAGKLAPDSAARAILDQTEFGPVAGTESHSVADAVQDKEYARLKQRMKYAKALEAQQERGQERQKSEGSSFIRTSLPPDMDLSKVLFRRLSPSASPDLSSPQSLTPAPPGRSRRKSSDAGTASATTKLGHIRFLLPDTEDTYYPQGRYMILNNGGEVVSVEEPSKWSRAIVVVSERIHSSPSLLATHSVLAEARERKLPIVTWRWLHQLLGYHWLPMPEIPVKDDNPEAASVIGDHATSPFFTTSESVQPSNGGYDPSGGSSFAEQGQGGCETSIASGATLTHHSGFVQLVEGRHGVDAPHTDTDLELPQPSPRESVKLQAPTPLVFAGLSMAFAMKKAQAEEAGEAAGRAGATVLSLVDTVKLCSKPDSSLSVLCVTSEREFSRLPALLQRCATTGRCQLVLASWMQACLSSRPPVLLPTLSFQLLPPPA